MTESNLPALRPATTLSINFPPKNEHITDSEADKTRKLVKDNGEYTNEGKAYINKKALPHLLGTDTPGVNRIYNDLENDEKIELGDKKLVSIPAVHKIMSERIQEPRDTLQKERIRDAEACLTALRDAPELDKYREAEESRNRNEQSLLKGKKIAAENITACQLTGEPLASNAHAHHIERRADKPRMSRDLDNVIVINPEAHEEVHRNRAESPQELQDLCKTKEWNNPVKNDSSKAKDSDKEE
ncbi:hypothetical protein [Janthinobacterium sp. BJB426]|uniref:hypothetical protein n=1 Tax=Janthinobacterium sp. BJB426 TaxID=2048010 RepID=UPI0013050F18|nr:hypothetical protein [Janthinobacterium sp. BJB426]